MIHFPKEPQVSVGGNLKGVSEYRIPRLSSLEHTDSPVVYQHWFLLILMKLQTKILFRETADFMIERNILQNVQNLVLISLKGRLLGNL